MEAGFKRSREVFLLKTVQLMGLGSAVREPLNCLLFIGNLLTVFHTLDQGLINYSLGAKCSLLPG